jgi:prevent-host-death family protein
MRVLCERYDAPMKTISALDLRRRVGSLLDEAAAGERIVIERAGQPLCALVPLSDLELTDPYRLLARELAALDDLQRLARRYPPPPGWDAAAHVREARVERDDRIRQNVAAHRARRAAP